MSAAAESLTVTIERVPTERRRREPMLIVGLSDPNDYPLNEQAERRVKFDVATALGVAPSNLEELGIHHPIFKAVRIPLVGLFVEEFDHLACLAHCQIIAKTRQKLGLSPGTDTPSAIELSRPSRHQSFINRCPAAARVH